MKFTLEVELDVLNPKMIFKKFPNGSDVLRYARPIFVMSQLD